MISKFYGIDVTEESAWMSGAVGVVVGRNRLLNSEYALAQRLHEAASDGISVRDATRTEIENLSYAGIEVETDSIGLRYILKNEVPSPKAYLLPLKEKPREMHQSPITGGDWHGRGT